MKEVVPRYPGMLGAGNTITMPSEKNHVRCSKTRVSVLPQLFVDV
jgi:hypothetical protein